MSSANRSRNLIVLAVLTAGLSLAYMFTNRVKVIAICRDVRVHMDGTYSAVVKKTGLSKKTMVTLYRLENLRNRKIASLDVTTSGKGDFLNEVLKLNIANKMNKKSKFPAKFDFHQGKSHVQAKMGCTVPQS